MFEGSYVALITPMTNAGLVDEAALRALVRWHRQQGSHGLVAVGTTGESAVLSAREHRRVIELVIDEAAAAIPVIAGCGSNNTVAAMELHQFAHQAGADAALHVTGYYNRPSQQGIVCHFEALASQNDLPIIVYNVPHRTATDITVETMARLAQLDSVVGVKDASADLSRPCRERLLIDQPFCWLSGEDATAVAYNVGGGQGCISVTANVAPARCAALQRACLRGDYRTAAAIQQQLMPLHQALFAEPSPAGVKYACSRLGLCTDKTRLPMVALQPRTVNLIDSAMAALER